MTTIASLAAESGLPIICQWAEMARAGCLLGYGANLTDLRRRTAHYVARILRGASPVDLPVEQASVSKSAINARTAKRISVELPNALVARADGDSPPDCPNAHEPGSALIDNAARELERGLDNLRREMDNRFGDRSDPPR